MAELHFYRTDCPPYVGGPLVVVCFLSSDKGSRGEYFILFPEEDGKLIGVGVTVDSRQRERIKEVDEGWNLQEEVLRRARRHLEREWRSRKGKAATIQDNDWSQPPLPLRKADASELIHLVLAGEGRDAIRRIKEGTGTPGLRKKCADLLKLGEFEEEDLVEIETPGVDF